MKENKRILKRRERGITLIALVITIIVLLILAGVSIAMLAGDNGILTQAQNAKNRTEEAQKEEENILTNYEDYINNATLDTATVGEIVKGGNKQYSKNGTAIIPEGFAIVPGLDDVSQGLVISDVANDTGNTGNQFVWVPVENFSEFKREHFGTVDQKWWTGDFVTAKMSENNLYEPTPNNTSGCTSETAEEVTKMYKSVEINHGFYIGRYEAGTESQTARNEESTIADNVVSKKEKFIYNYIGWNNDGKMETETGGAVEKSRNFDTQSGHTNITSTLVYGVQWDAVMRWLSNGTEQEQNWLKDSSEKGNYEDNEDSNNPAKTGSNDNYQMKHIYDLAGNAAEWTMEAYSTDRRVRRGGYCYNNAANDPCTQRGGDAPNKSNSFFGFRIAFYL